MADLIDARSWSAMVEAAGPASLLVVIESRLGPALRRALTPDDIWQESLLSAWRDRATCRAADQRSFRLWLLSVIDNRIRDAADHHAALKRGGAGIGRAAQGPPRAPAFPVTEADAAITTTPSRLASFREQASIMRDALSGLDDDVRDVVRLRLFEQMPVEVIAEQLGIGSSAVRHRFRRGVEAYHRLLQALLASRGGTITADSRAALSRPLSSDLS